MKPESERQIISLIPVNIQINLQKLNTGTGVFEHKKREGAIHILGGIKEAVKTLLEI